MAAQHTGKVQNVFLEARMLAGPAPPKACIYRHGTGKRSGKRDRMQNICNPLEKMSSGKVSAPQPWLDRTWYSRYRGSDMHGGVEGL